jgi:hypothetical protein
MLEPPLARLLHQALATQRTSTSTPKVHIQHRHTLHPVKCSIYSCMHTQRHATRNTQHSAEKMRARTSLRQVSHVAAIMIVILVFSTVCCILPLLLHLLIDRTAGSLWGKKDDLTKRSAVYNQEDESKRGDDASAALRASTSDPDRYLAHSHT